MLIFNTKKTINTPLNRLFFTIFGSLSLLSSARSLCSQSLCPSLFLQVTSRHSRRLRLCSTRRTTTSIRTTLRLVSHFSDSFLLFRSLMRVDVVSAGRSRRRTWSVWASIHHAVCLILRRLCSWPFLVMPSSSDKRTPTMIASRSSGRKLIYCRF